VSRVWEETLERRAQRELPVQRALKTLATDQLVSCTQSLPLRSMSLTVFVWFFLKHRPKSWNVCHCCQVDCSDVANATFYKRCSIASMLPCSSSVLHRVRNLGITSSHTGRFSKFFHFQNLLQICNKAIVKHPTTPQTRHYTTLWNIDVRKLACPVRCGSLSEDKHKLARILTRSSYIFKWNLYITTYFTNLLYQLWYCL